MQFTPTVMDVLRCLVLTKARRLLRKRNKLATPFIDVAVRLPSIRFFDSVVVFNFVCGAELNRNRLYINRKQVLMLVTIYRAEIMGYINKNTEIKSKYLMELMNVNSN